MDVVKKLIAVELVIIIVVLTAVVGEVFPPGRPRIRVDGEVYTLSGGEVYSIPDGSEKIGLLNGITHQTAERPAEDMWGTNLDAKYAGCQLWRDVGREDVIYLYDYSGYFLRFVRQGG